MLGVGSHGNPAAGVVNDAVLAAECIGEVVERRLVELLVINGSLDFLGQPGCVARLLRCVLRGGHKASRAYQTAVGIIAHRMVCELPPSAIEFAKQSLVLRVAPYAARRMYDKPVAGCPHRNRVGKAVAPKAYPCPEVHTGPIGARVVGVGGYPDDGVFLDGAPPAQRPGTILAGTRRLRDMKCHRGVAALERAVHYELPIKRCLEVFVVGEQETLPAGIGLPVEQYVDMSLHIVELLVIP